MSPHPHAPQGSRHLVLTPHILLLVPIRSERERKLTSESSNSKNCPHSFSKESIYSYIKSYKHTLESSPPPSGSALCPISGCSAILSKDSLKENEGLKRRAEAWARREKEEIEAGRAKKGTQYMAVVDSDEEDD